MSEYRNLAMRVDGDIGLSALLVMNIFQANKAGIFGGNPLPKHLMDAAWNDAGYCLDAPQLIPAGGSSSFDLDEFESLPEQLTVERP